MNSDISDTSIQCLTAPMFTSRKKSRIWLVEFFILKNRKNLIDWQLRTRNLAKMLAGVVGQVCLTWQIILCTFAHMLHASAMQNIFVCILFGVTFFSCVVSVFFLLWNSKISDTFFLLVSLLHFAQCFDMCCA